MVEVQWLDEHSETATTLLVFPTLFKNFDHYLDFVELAESMLVDQGYEGVYQLATFHPDYCFDGAEPDDAANYTNRSPYAMVHLLREESVEQAIAFYGDTDAIPERNIAKLTAMGSCARSTAGRRAGTRRASGRRPARRSGISRVRWSISSGARG